VRAWWIGTSTSKTRITRLSEFGADVVVDPSDVGWIDQVLKATDGQGVNVIVDMVSGATVNGSMKAAAVRGRMVNVGRLGGMKLISISTCIRLKRLNYIGN